MPEYKILKFGMVSDARLFDPRDLATTPVVIYFPALAASGMVCNGARFSRTHPELPEAAARNIGLVEIGVASGREYPSPVAESGLHSFDVSFKR